MIEEQRLIYFYFSEAMIMDKKCNVCGKEMREVGRETDVRGREYCLLECDACDKQVIRRVNPEKTANKEA